MPHISETIDNVDRLSFCWGNDPRLLEAVREALRLGHRVEVRSSSFSDPGDDWNEILVNGVALPGSRRDGY